MISTRQIRVKGAGLFLTLAFVAAVGSGCRREAAAVKSKPTDGGRIEEGRTLLVYVPPGIDSNRKVPLVLALSPGADAPAMLSAWKEVADRHGWIVAASKKFRNGIAWDRVFAQVEADLDWIARTYPVDTTRVVVTGLSGGAMASHAISQHYPGRVRAVVANTGMMEESYRREEYPLGKLAVFLASPSDFRYQEMKRDRLFLGSKGWTTEWIEFSGGHALAPASAYEQAATWLEHQW